MLTGQDVRLTKSVIFLKNYPAHQASCQRKEFYELYQNLSLYRTEYINFINFLQAIFWHDGELLVFELQEH